MKTIIRRHTSKPLSKLSLEKLIYFLRGKYNFSENFTLYLGENSHKGYNGEAKPRQIYLNFALIDSEKKLMEVFAHEFIHMIQFENGSLGWDDNGNLTWHGESNQKWTENPLLAPWELDAIIETIDLEKEIEKLLDRAK